MVKDENVLIDIVSDDAHEWAADTGIAMLKDSLGKRYCIFQSSFLESLDYLEQGDYVLNVIINIAHNNPFDNLCLELGLQASDFDLFSEGPIAGTVEMPVDFLKLGGYTHVFCSAD